MPRRAVVRALQVAGNEANAVPRVRRMRNLEANAEKMKAKSDCTYTENNVVFVHRCKKRRRVSPQEKEQVLAFKLLASRLSHQFKLFAPEKT